MGIEEKVLARLLPTGEEESALSEATADLVSRLSSDDEARELGMEPRLVGSVAKGTYLREPDLDVFLVFPIDTPFDTMASICERLGGTNLDSLERRFADHPYVHGLFLGYEVDLVPCYHMEMGERVVSAVDRTPLHTDHIIENILPHQRNEARLLKAFMKGIGVYGADSRSRGFSGYLTELLILYYGNFISVLNAAADWKQGEEILTNSGVGGFEDNLIVNDPVDPRRNVASAVHIDSLSVFIHASQEYIVRGDERFFFPRMKAIMGVNDALEAISARGTRLLCAIASVGDLSDDNLHSQAHKALNGLSLLLSRRGFKVLNSKHYHDGDLYFIFELEHDTLPVAELHNGPPVWVDNSQDFLSKWRGASFGPPFIEDGRWKVFRRRSSTTAADVLRSSLKEASLGAGLSRNGMTVLDHEGTLKEDLMEIVTEFLDTRMSWDV